MTGRFTPQSANYEERIRASFTRQQFMGFIGVEKLCAIAVITLMQLDGKADTRE